MDLRKDKYQVRKMAVVEDMVISQQMFTKYRLLVFPSLTNRLITMVLVSVKSDRYYLEAKAAMCWYASSTVCFFGSSLETNIVGGFW